MLNMAGQQGRDVTGSKRFMQHLAGSGFKSCQCERAAHGALLGEAPLSHFNRLHIYCRHEQKTGDFSVFESIQTGSGTHPDSYCI